MSAFPAGMGAVFRGCQLRGGETKGAGCEPLHLSALPNMFGSPNSLQGREGEHPGPAKASPLSWSSVRFALAAAVAGMTSRRPVNIHLAPGLDNVRGDVKINRGPVTAPADEGGGAAKLSPKILELLSQQI
jgi:hypothetical protein